MRLLTAGWVINNRSAAVEKELVSATAIKALRASVSIAGMFRLYLIQGRLFIVFHFPYCIPFWNGNYK
jgi:hypothetical protein